MTVLEPRLVSVRDAASALGLGAWRVYELLDGGHLQGVRDGRKRLVLVESIDEYVARKVAEAAT